MNKFNLSELKEKYFDYLKNRDLKKQTLKMYKIILKEIDGYYTKDEFFLHANKIINNSNLRNNTKALRCRIFLAFTNKIKEFTNEFWDDSKIKRKKAEQTRIAYTDSEINLLLDELKYFNNIKFEYIFKFLLLTGIRISEFENIDWVEFVKRKDTNDYFIRANKNNNERPLFLSDEVENLPFNAKLKGFKKNFISLIPKLKISIQTIKNTFTLFKHFVIKRNPWFKKVISAHLLRHTFITNLFTNGFSAEEIMFYTGHKSPEILRQTYISKGHNYYYELYQDKINNKTKKAAKIEQKQLLSEVITLKIDDLKNFIKQTIQDQNNNNLEDKLNNLNLFLQKN